LNEIICREGELVSSLRGRGKRRKGRKSRWEGRERSGTYLLALERGQGSLQLVLRLDGSIDEGESGTGGGEVARVRDGALLVEGAQHEALEVSYSRHLDSVGASRVVEAEVESRGANTFLLLILTSHPA
jgi:hypothetical protein